MRRSTRSKIPTRTLVLAVSGILFSLSAVGGVLAFNILHREPAIDSNTLCRTDAALEYHTVMLVDATDPFTHDQADRLRAAVAEERAAVPRFGKFTLLFISPKTPFEPEAILSLCNPGSGRDANPLYSNPSQIDKAWGQSFAGPIDAAVSRLLSLPNAPRSPILESITAATWRHDFDGRIPHRRLHIVSDLLQNDPGGYSHYRRGDTWVRFNRSGLSKKVEADLADAVVMIDYLHRPQAAQYQNESHRNFWQRWLTERGATSVDFGIETTHTPSPPAHKVATKVANRPVGN